MSAFSLHTLSNCTHSPVGRSPQPLQGTRNPTGAPSKAIRSAAPPLLPRAADRRALAPQGGWSGSPHPCSCGICHHQRVPVFVSPMGKPGLSEVNQPVQRRSQPAGVCRPSAPPTRLTPAFRTERSPQPPGGRPSARPAVKLGTRPGFTSARARAVKSRAVPKKSNAFPVKGLVTHLLKLRLFPPFLNVEPLCGRALGSRPHLGKNEVPAVPGSPRGLAHRGRVTL